MKSTRQERITTGLVLGVVVIAGIFAIPTAAFLLLCLAVFAAAAAEMVRILRFWAPGSPLWVILALWPSLAVALVVVLERNHGGLLAPVIVAVFAGLVLIAALVMLWGRAPVTEAAVATGFLAFTVPYFVMPTVALYYLHTVDRWLVLVLVALVALNDTAAYFVGSWIGKHKLAPRVSPKKTWEGSIAGWLASVVAMALWSASRFGEVLPEWLLIAASTAVFAQLGDLFESLVKRGAGVKDSSNVLPGHGGLYDRVDALLFAAPVFVLGFWAFGLEALYAT